MTRHLVFEPPAGKEQAVATPSDRAVFVRDAFSIWAFLFPWLWLLRYGLVVSALVVLLACGGLGMMARAGFGLLVVPLVPLLGLLVALEGPSLRARSLRRRRYREAGTVEAGDAAEAAILYFAGADLPRRPDGKAAETALPWRFEAAAATATPKRRFWRRKAAA